MKHFWNAATASGYWYSHQPLGREFIPGELRGYFSDMTAKATWGGPTADGIPLIENREGNLIEFPITVFQKGLGHWDLFLASSTSDARERAEFLRVANWAVKTQDTKGGWEIWAQARRDLDSVYSAMAQGEGISVLVRAHALTGDLEYLTTAQKAVQLLSTPVAQGGTGWESSHGWVLEEYPLLRPKTVLNGWIFALYGLHDICLALPEAEPPRRLLNDTLGALAKMIPVYDAGFWSYYDTAGDIALPFYQQLHASQLEALALTFPEYEEIFSTYAARFRSQWGSHLNRSRAIAVKIHQKLTRPAPFQTEHRKKIMSGPKHPPRKT